MKPKLFKVWVMDDPEMATLCGREWLAHALRAYRKHPERHVLHRVRSKRHSYTVTHGSYVLVFEPEADADV
jgi:hypothetical protein